jgi:Kelch motif
VWRRFQRQAVGRCCVGHTTTRTQHLHSVLQQAAGVWCTPVPAGPASEEVTRRCRHAVAAVGPYVFIFGGLRGSTLLDDFLLADDSSGTELSICDPRSPAWWATVCVVMLSVMLPACNFDFFIRWAVMAQGLAVINMLCDLGIWTVSAGGSGSMPSTAHRQRQQCWRRQQPRKLQQQQRSVYVASAPWRTSPALMRTSATGDCSQASQFAAILCSCCVAAQTYPHDSVSVLRRRALLAAHVQIGKSGHCYGQCTLTTVTAVAAATP